MENAHGAVFHFALPADEPVAVGTVDLMVEQADQPRIIGVGKMAAVHDRDAQPLSRRFQH